MSKQLANQNGTINREVRVAPEVMKLLKAMGVPIPDSVKEIETEVVATETTKQILIPKTMTKLEAARELENQYKNEEQKIDHVAQFDGWNWKDALVAIKRTTEQVFGWVRGRETMWTTPTEIDVQVDIKNGKPVNERAFLNGFKVGPWEDCAGNVDINRSGVVSVVLHAKKKYAGEITEYFNLIRKQLETNSIYRGRNIVVTASPNYGVDFEIIENKISDKIILNNGTRLVIDNFVLGSLQDTGKRTFLFTGNYGNGKTEIAMQVGHEGVAKHGQSFFYVKETAVFEQLLVQSKKYQPCIIFLEDIDEIASGEERDARMNGILNTLDGVQTKGNSLTTIFTTNHPDRINSALRRPGRIDLMIKFENPDRDSKLKIMKAYFHELNGSDVLKYDDIVEFLPEAQGAVIAEICKRAVKLTEKKGGFITEDIVLACIESMSFQLEMMNGKADGPNEYEQFFGMLFKFMAPEFKDQLGHISK